MMDYITGIITGIVLANGILWLWRTYVKPWLGTRKKGHDK